MKAWNILRNKSIVYSTLAEDQHDALKRFKQQRDEKEWELIISNKDEYRVGCLQDDVSYSFEQLS